MPKSVRALYPNLYKSKFCKLLRGAIADEKKAPIDYLKLKHEASILPRGPTPKRFRDAVDSIIEDEKEHKEKLVRYHILYCE